MPAFQPHSSLLGWVEPLGRMSEARRSFAGPPLTFSQTFVALTWMFSAFVLL